MSWICRVTADRLSNLVLIWAVRIYGTVYLNAVALAKLNSYFL